MIWELLQALPNKTVSGRNCSSVQGMCCDEQYAYTAKICTDNSFCFISRTDLDSGETVDLPFHASLTSGVSDCGILNHANDITAVKVNGETHLFVSTMNAGASVVRMVVREGELYFVQSYELVKLDGSQFSANGIAYVRTEGKKLHLLIKSGMRYFACRIDESFPQQPGDRPKTITCHKLFETDTENALFLDEDGNEYSVDYIDTWTGQGNCFDSETSSLFVPRWKPLSNENVFLIYNIESAVTEKRFKTAKNYGTVISPVRTSLRAVHASASSFEIEDCDFRMLPPESGKRTMLFACNSTAGLEGVYSTSVSSGSTCTTPLITDETVVYTVRYDAGGGSGSMAASRCLSGVKRRLRPNAFVSASSMPFVGWALEREATGEWLCALPDGRREWVKTGSSEALHPMIFEDEADFVDLTEINGDVLIAHAQWFDLESIPPAEAAPQTPLIDPGVPLIQWVNSLIEWMKLFLNHIGL